MQEICIFGPDPDHSHMPPNAQVRYMYDEGSKGASVELVGARRFGKNHLDARLQSGRLHCTRDWFHSHGAPASEIDSYREKGQPFGDTYLIDWKNNPDGFLRVVCKLRSIVDRHTYTERRIYFCNSGYQGGEYESDNPHDAETLDKNGFGSYGYPLKWTLDLSDVSNIGSIAFVGGTNASANYPATNDALRAEGSVRELGATRGFVPSDLVEVRWESLTSESLRDIYIVIIGALVALGAAMLLEALRPFIEWLIGAHEPSGQVASIQSAPLPAPHSDSTPSPSPQTPPKPALDSPVEHPQAPAPDAASPSQSSQFPSPSSAEILGPVRVAEM